MKNSSFLRYVFLNAESSLASSDPKWMGEYAGLVKDKQLGSSMLDKIMQERTLAKKHFESLFFREAWRKEDHGSGKLCRPEKVLFPCSMPSRLNYWRNFGRPRKIDPSWLSICCWWSMRLPADCAPPASLSLETGCYLRKRGGASSSNPSTMAMFRKVDFLPWSGTI